MSDFLSVHFLIKKKVDENCESRMKVFSKKDVEITREAFLKTKKAIPKDRLKEKNRKNYHGAWTMA